MDGHSRARKRRATAQKRSRTTDDLHLDCNAELLIELLIAELIAEPHHTIPLPTMADHNHESDSEIDNAFDDAYRSARIQAGQDGAGPSHSDADADARPNHLPLSAIPDALTNLGLSAHDATVLDLFADVAYAPRRRGANTQKAVARHEFRQVVAVLLQERHANPDPESGRRRPKRKAAVAGRRSIKAIEAGDEESDSADEFSGSPGLTESDRDEAQHEYSFARSRRQRRRKRVSSSSSEQEEQEQEPGPRRRKRKASPSAPLRLNPDQREQVAAAFELFVEKLDRPTTHLTLPDIRAIAQSVGEKLSDKEVRLPRPSPR